MIVVIVIYDHIKGNMDEVKKYQGSVCESLEQENQRLEELMAKHNLVGMTEEVKEYKDKLARMKREMMIIGDKTKKLRQRAARILDDKVKEDLEDRRQRERMTLLEKHLEPVVNVNQNTTTNQE